MVHNFTSAYCKGTLTILSKCRTFPQNKSSGTRTAEQVEQPPDFSSTATPLYLAICLMQLVCPC
jgi:hypothetical protein